MVLTAILVAFVLVASSAILTDFEEREYELTDEGNIINMVESEASQTNINRESDRQSFKRQMSMIPDYSSSVQYIEAAECFNVELRNPSETIALECVEGFEGLNFIANPSITAPNENVELLVEGYEDDYEEFEWNLDDGTIETNEEDTFEHEYDSTGTYEPSVTVIYSDEEVSASTRVEVTSSLNVQIDTEENEVNEGEEVEFTAETTSGIDIEEYRWDFGDGETSTGTDLETVTHEYEDEGQYNVEVEVEDEFGDEESDSEIIEVESFETGQIEFTETGSHTWDVPEDVEEVDVLIVAGGGGGGMQEDFTSAGAGGGGAGGVVFAGSYDVTPGGSVDLEVGDGGSAATSGDNYGEDGQNSVFDNTLTAIGGGGGAGGNTGDDQQVQGEDGGSGGGSRAEGGSVDGGEGIQEGENLGFIEYGNDGGSGEGGSGNDQGAGGGGGAETEGSSNPDPDGATGGDGGSGVYFAHIFGDVVGENGYFAGGGGGGAGEDDETPGTGGIGGGGSGTNEVEGSAESGQDNTGGGGGGGSSNSEAEGGDGGEGIIIISQNPQEVSDQYSGGWTEVEPEDGGNVEDEGSNLYIEADAEGDNIYDDDSTSASRRIESEEEFDLSDYDTLYADYSFTASRRDDDEGNDETGSFEIGLNGDSRTSNDGVEENSVDVSEEHNFDGHPDKRTAARSGRFELDVSSIDSANIRFHSRAHSSNSGKTEAEVYRIYME